MHRGLATEYNFYRYILLTFSAGLPLAFTVVYFDAELPVCFLIYIISFHLMSDVERIFGLTIKFIVSVSIW